MLETAMFVVNLLVLVLAIWALIDCAFRPAAAFPAIERQTKMAWLAFLAIATVVIYFFGGISLIGMILIFGAFPAVPKASKRSRQTFAIASIAGCRNLRVSNSAFCG